MDDFKFPVIKGKIPDPEPLSMDEYLAFVEFNLKYVVDIKSAEKQKREMIGKVVPFKLK